MASIRKCSRCKEQAPRKEMLYLAITGKGVQSMLGSAVKRASFLFCESCAEDVLKILSDAAPSFFLEEDPHNEFHL